MCTIVYLNAYSHIYSFVIVWCTSIGWRQIHLSLSPFPVQSWKSETLHLNLYSGSCTLSIEWFSRFNAPYIHERGATSTLRLHGKSPLLLPRFYSQLLLWIKTRRNVSEWKMKGPRSNLPTLRVICITFAPNWAGHVDITWEYLIDGQCKHSMRFSQPIYSHLVLSFLSLESDGLILNDS